MKVANSVLEIDVYNSHAVYYISTEPINNFSAILYSYECIFTKAALSSLANKFLAGTCQPPNKVLADFTQFTVGALENTNNFCVVSQVVSTLV